MRTFEDPKGGSWTARVHGDAGYDYKGRYVLVLDGADGAAVTLSDVRWNSERSAERALATMAVPELNRRLRSAVRRGTVHPSG